MFKILIMSSLLNEWKTAHASHAHSPVNVMSFHNLITAHIKSKNTNATCFILEALPFVYCYSALPCRRKKNPVLPTVPLLKASRWCMIEEWAERSMPEFCLRWIVIWKKTSHLAGIYGHHRWSHLTCRCTVLCSSSAAKNNTVPSYDCLKCMQIIILRQLLLPILSRFNPRSLCQTSFWL